MVYDSFIDSLYTAIKGKGVYKNDEKTAKRFQHHKIFLLPVAFFAE